MNRPEGFERAQRENPTFKDTTERAGQLKEEFAAPGIEIVNSLLEEVANMHIAQRFSRSHPPEHHFLESGTLNPSFANLPESEFKRSELTQDLQKIRTQIVILAARLEDVVMGIEATKID